MINSEKKPCAYVFTISWLYISIMAYCIKSKVSKVVANHNDLLTHQRYTYGACTKEATVGWRYHKRVGNSPDPDSDKSPTNWRTSSEFPRGQWMGS